MATPAEFLDSAARPLLWLSGYYDKAIHALDSEFINVGNFEADVLKQPHNLVLGPDVVMHIVVGKAEVPVPKLGTPLSPVFLCNFPDQDRLPACLYFLDMTPVWPLDASFEIVDVMLERRLSAEAVERPIAMRKYDKDDTVRFDDAHPFLQGPDGVGYMLKTVRR